MEKYTWDIGCEKNLRVEVYTTKSEIIKIRLGKRRRWYGYSWLVFKYPGGGLKAIEYLARHLYNVWIIGIEVDKDVLKDL